MKATEAKKLRPFDLLMFDHEEAAEEMLRVIEVEGVNVKVTRALKPTSGAWVDCSFLIKPSRLQVQEFTKLSSS
jgi:hypothetical protein